MLYSFIEFLWKLSNSLSLLTDSKILGVAATSKNPPFSFSLILRSDFLFDYSLF